MPSNFKTYEAQSRLLAAVIASDPNIRLNFKAIAKHYGSDTSVSGIEHRFRPIRKAALVIRKAVAKGQDAKDYQDCVTMNEKEIAKYFGESTPMGIEFQFRSIKKEAKNLRAAHESGSPMPPTPSANRTTSAASTPRSTTKRKAPASDATPKSAASVRSSATTATPGSTAKRARTTASKKQPAPAPAAPAAKDSYESTEDDVDYDALDTTPTRSLGPGGRNQQQPRTESIPDGLNGDFAPPSSHASFATLNRPIAPAAYAMSGALPTPAPPTSTGGMGSTPELDDNEYDDDEDEGFAIVDKPITWPGPSSTGGGSQAYSQPQSQSQQAPVFSQQSNGSIFGNGGGAHLDEIDYSAGMAGQDSFSLEDGEI